MPDETEGLEREEEASPNAFTQYLYENMDDPAIQTVFCNRMVALIQDSNVLLYFGTESPRGGSDHPEVNSLKYSTRVVMSHAYFMDSMRYLAARFNALHVLYEGPISVQEVTASDPERVARSAEFLNVIPEDLGVKRNDVR